MNRIFKYRVFLSHSSKDQDMVEQIYKAIVQLGMHCYVDNRDQRAGEYIPQILKDEIDDCHILVAVYSMDGYASHWVHEEVGMAYYADKKIIAICTPDIRLGELQTQIGKKVIIIRSDAPEEAIKQLVDNLGRLRLRHQLKLVVFAIGVFILWRYIKKSNRGTAGNEYSTMNH